MSNSEKKRGENDKAPSSSQAKEQSQSAPDRAQADDITIGDEAQKQRDKMQRQEKAEGDRR